MNKSKTYIIAAVIALLLTGIAIVIRSQQCECAKYKTFKVITIKKDFTLETKIDSMCVIGGKRNGDLILTKF